MALTQQPNEIAAPGERRLPMTYNEFLAWDEETVHAEWVDGEVIIFMPPNDRHQVVSGFFYNLISLFVRAFNLGEVRSAPYMMRAFPDGSAREPDILFVAAAHRDRITKQGLAGPADLIVEVVSPESAGRDRAEKFYEYEEAGIPEYVILDPRLGRERIDFYRLTEEDKYLAVLPDNAGRYYSAVLSGFWFDASWLRQDLTPDPFLTLAQIAPAAFDQVIAMLTAQRREGTQ